MGEKFFSFPPQWTTPNRVCPRGLSGEVLPDQASPLCVLGRPRSRRQLTPPCICFPSALASPPLMVAFLEFCPSTEASARSPLSVSRELQGRRSWGEGVHGSRGLGATSGNLKESSVLESFHPGSNFNEATEYDQALMDRFRHSDLILWTRGEHIQLSHTGSPGQGALFQTKCVWF